MRRELAQLGYEGRVVRPGWILFEGDSTALCRANLWLRAADRVLLRVGAFEATDFGQLFDRTHALPWHEWIPADAAFPVDGRSIKSQLSSVPACQKIVKKAVVEKLRATHGVSQLEESGAMHRIEIALLENEAALLLDTTGASLHKRGYRKLVGKAPLKETLAAALVLLSFWKPDRPLIDPFCGSGTIPIEAALIGRNIAPGLHREFAAEAWPAIAASLWEEARREAEAAMRPPLAERIIGTDNDLAALKLARHHAEAAGVADDVHFQQHDFAELSSKRRYGCLITNPPYGARLGERFEAEAVYRTMPEVLRRLKTWSHYILTSHARFEDLVGRKADRRRKLYNGRIECTYYQFHGPRPGEAFDDGIAAVRQRLAAATPKESTAATEVNVGSAAASDTAVQSPVVEEVAADEAQSVTAETDAVQPVATAVARPAFGGLLPEAGRQAEEYANRLRKRARHLRRWPKRGIYCYRLYERDVPDVPLVVDRYEGCLHVAEFERPHDRTPSQHADWLDLMIRTTADVLDVPHDRVFFKQRQRQQGTAQYERCAEAGQVFVVREGGLRFEVNLSDYVDTGLFLDHRLTRDMFRKAAQGRRVLNLFGYTGAFTVYAAAGEAVSTTTVDLSNTYLDWAVRNLQLNGLARPQHRRVRADATAFLDDHPPGPAYDLAIVDPPTYSNSKSLEHDWDVQRDHAALLNGVLELMAPGGEIFFSTNFRRFKLAEEEIHGATFREITRQTIPEDFRNQRIHRCWRMVKQEA